MKRFIITAIVLLICIGLADTVITFIPHFWRMVLGSVVGSLIATFYDYYQQK